jgi:chromate transporter
MKTTGNREKLLPLFLTFLKIGAFTFGGGYAMIPLIQKEAVEKRHWIRDEDILDIVAIAESTPGPIAINSATFVGYKVAGFAGSFAATVGVVLPSFLIILGISYVLRQFESLTVVQYAFSGIRAGVLVLIIKALISMYRQCPKGLLSYLLMAAAFVTVAFFGGNVLLVIAGCAAVGLVSAFAAGRRTKNDLS